MTEDFGADPGHLKFAVHHLAEAIGEITAALTAMSISSSTAAEDIGVREHLVHAYQHLNWYWNGSRSGLSSLAALPEEEFRRMAALPNEISDEVQFR